MYGSTTYTTLVYAFAASQISEDITVPRRDSNLTAWVNVIYGCNERCTYCVVPFTRGQEQSRQPEDIRREMLALGEAGQSSSSNSGGSVSSCGSQCWPVAIPRFM